jgi:hypothetical protein
MLEKVVPGAGDVVWASSRDVETGLAVHCRRVGNWLSGWRMLLGNFELHFNDKR